MKNEIIDKVHKPKAKKSIGVSKISHFLDFKHLEELFLMLKLLTPKDLENFLTSFKSSKAHKDQRLDSIIRNSKSPKDLLNSIKLEIVGLLKQDHIEINNEIRDRRKKGEDTLIYEMKAAAIPLKINLFSAMEEKTEFFKVKKMIEALRTELKESKKEPVKQEEPKPEVKQIKKRPTKSKTEAEPSNSI